MQTPKKALHIVHRVSLLAVTALIGAFMFLNIVPWVEAAKSIAGNIPNLVTGADALYRVPILGWLIRFIAENLAIVLGFTLWLTVQSIQILPTLIERPQVLHPLIKAWEGVELPQKGDGSKMDRLRQRFNESVVQLIDNLKFYRSIAYCVEAFVCLYVYPPYVGGWQQLVTDYPALDVAYISWPNIISAIVTMFAFEFLFRVALNLWGLTEIVKFAPKAKQDKPTEGAKA